MKIIDIDNIILENKNLIYKITTYFKNYSNKEDLFQAGVVGMLIAYKNYDSSYDIKFTTYAYPYILGEMKKLVREDKTIKVNRNISCLNKKIIEANSLLSQKLYRSPTIYELSEFLQIDEDIIINALNSNITIKSIDEPVSGKDNDYSLHEIIPDKIDDINTLIALKDELNELNDFESSLMEERYLCDKTQKETAEDLGISQVQVSRYEKKVLKKLKEKLAC